MAEGPMPYIGEVIQILPRKTYVRSGVYFLHYEGQVVYVGQAENMLRRIGQHLSEGVKLFDAVSCLPCEPAKCASNERFYIAKFAPRYNACAVAKEARALIAAGHDGASTIKQPAYVAPALAAAMLGLTLPEFNKVKKRLRSVKKRIPRTNIKRTIYDTASINEFRAQSG